MSGPIIRLGRHITSTASGVDFATVENSQQLASFTNPQSDSRQLIVYAMGSWIGNYTGTNVVRYGLLWLGDDANSPGGKRPGGVAAYTSEVAANRTYTGATEGSMHEANLTAPFLTQPNYPYTVAIANRGGTASVAMIQAANIPNETNNNFYRKNISGNIPQDSVGSEMTFQGQLGIWAIAEQNVAPRVPQGVQASISAGNRRPGLISTFSDANRVLNNGVQWDYVSQSEHVISWGGAQRWRQTFSETATARSTNRVARACGVDVPFNTTITYQVRHRDRGGLWSGWATITFTVPHANHAPNRPTALSPSGDITNGSRAVTLTSHFSDADETLPDGQRWDYLTAYQILIRRRSDNVTVWDSGWLTASSTERSTKTTRRAYTLPAWDTEYAYYVRHRDRSGAVSPYAVTYLTAFAGAAVDRPTSPTGRVTSITNPGTIRAVYRSTGNLAATSLQARLLTAGGAVLRNGAVLPTKTTPGQTLSASWSVSGLGTLQWGMTYNLQVRAKDSAGNWSRWSPSRSFTTNDPPTIPTIYKPQDNEVRSTKTSLSVQVYDDDGTPSAVTVFIEIYNEAGTLLRTVEAPYNPPALQPNVYTAEVDAVGITSYGTYRWRAYAFDGVTYSGGASSAADAARSPMWTYTYAAVPSPTITGPTTTIQTAHPAVTWEVSTQATYRVIMRDGSTIVYDTGELADPADRGHVITNRFWKTGQSWTNNRTLAITVYVRDDTGLQGNTDALLVTLRYPPVDTLQISASPFALPGTHGTNAIRLTHPQTTYGTDEFRAYRYRRVESSAPEGYTSPDESTAVWLARVTDPTDTELIDAEVTAGQLYRYELVVEIEKDGNTILSGTTATAWVRVDFDGIIVHMPQDPEAYVCHHRAASVGDDYAPEVSWSRDTTVVTTLSGVKPVSFGGPLQMSTATFSAAAFDDDVVPTEERRKQLATILNEQSAFTSHDGRPHIVCWREGRGGPFGRMYGEIVSVNQTHTIQKTYALQIDFEERAFTLGVDIDGGAS